MKAPLDIWQQLPKYQTAAQDFFESEAGYLFILTMQSKNLPNNTESLDNLKGFQRFIDQIPTLFRSTFVESEKRTEAQRRILAHNQFKQPVNQE